MAAEAATELPSSQMAGGWRALGTPPMLPLVKVAVRSYDPPVLTLAKMAARPHGCPYLNINAIILTNKQTKNKKQPI